MSATLRISTLIDDYERGAISQASFLHDVDTLLGTIERRPPAWHESFKSEWWTIEQVFAASKEPDLKPPEEEAAALVRSALANMRRLLMQGGADVP